MTPARRAMVAPALALLAAGAALAMPGAASAAEAAADGTPARDFKAALANQPAGCSWGFQSDRPIMARGRAEFLERNYFFYNLPPIAPPQNQPLVFEAQVAPHFFFYNGLDKLPFSDRCDTFLQAFSVSFILKLRMVNDASTPVRPPSYMPRFNYQMFFLGRPGRRELRVVEVRLSLGHHSNGQQYCRLDDKTIMTPGACEPIDAGQIAADRGRLNFRSGDFATDYYQIAAHYERLWLDGAGYEHYRLVLGASFEGNPLDWHLPFTLPGQIDREEYDLYGPYRPGVDVAGAWHNDSDAVADWLSSHLPGPSSLWRALGGTVDHATYRFDGMLQVFPWDVPSGVADYRWSMELSWSPDWWSGLGLFVRYFQGQDYLNILYLEGPVHTVQFGVLWDQSPQIAYQIRPGEQ